MLSITFTLAALFEIIFPFLLGFWLIRRYHTAWKLFGIGMLIFVASQIVHIPLLIGVTSLFQNGTLPAPPPEIKPYFNAVLLGLFAGLCEEPARWVGYRLIKDRGDSWEAALTLGAGHGGIESIFIGVSVLVNFMIFFLLREGDLQMPGLDAADVAAYWNTPWHLPLAGAVERLIAITLHITLSVMVWLSVRQRSWIWMVAAVLMHALFDSLAVLLLQTFHWPAWGIEGALLVMALLCLGILYGIYQRIVKPLQTAAADHPVSD